MAPLRRWVDAFRARVGVGGDAPERDMDEEMRFHLEMATRRNVERGLSADDARRAALATFGGVTHHQETALDALPSRWLDDLRQDLGYAIRTLRRNPGFAISVTLTLALGIGANTAIFSVVNGVLLRPLPVADPQHFVYIGWSWGKSDVVGALSAYKIDYLRQHATTLSGVTSIRSIERTLGSGEGARSISGARLSRDFLEVMGRAPMIGRGFSVDEDTPGGPAVVMLGNTLWQRTFAGDRGVIGKQIRLDDTSYTVIGVMPPGFRIPGVSLDDAEFFVPLQLRGDPAEKGNNYTAMARIKRDRSRDQVRADLEATGRAFKADHANAATDVEGYYLTSFERLFVGELKRLLWILLGAVTFVLLISAANAANLLLARAAAREREIVVRTALGARRSRIVRQLLCEGIVLSAVSGFIGLAFGAWGLRVLLAMMPSQLPRADEIGLDIRVLLFVAGIVLVTGLVFGLAAALPTARTSLASVLGERTRSTGKQRSRDLLVMSETALAIVLLAGAGLLLTSFANLRNTDPGFAVDNVVAVRFERMPAGYDKVDRIWEFERQLIERISAAPGVQSVAGLPNFPLKRGMNLPVAEAGVAESGDGGVEYRSITPTYFETLEIPVLQGRAFSLSDDRKAPRVAIINEAMAKKFFAGTNALGRQLEIGRYKDQWMGPEFMGAVEIVGVARDVREIELGRPPRRTVYIPMAQGYDRLANWPLLVIRALPSASLQRVIDEAVRSVDPRVPSPQLQPMPAIVGASIAEQRFQTTLLSLFAATALALTAIGIFGVVSYGVQQRVREIGVRMALGASPLEVLRLIVGRSLRFVGAGLAIGVLSAIGLTRFLSGILYDVKATDPLTFSLAVITLLVVAFLASYLPARRATRIDPVRALRLE